MPVANFSGLFERYDESSFTSKVKFDPTWSPKHIITTYYFTHNRIAVELGAVS